MTGASESAWLVSAVPFSITASSWSLSAGEVVSDPSRDHRRQKIIEGRFFSQRLLLSYHLVIWTLILLVAAVHWHGHVLRRRHRKNRHLNQSTLHGGDDAAVSPISQRLNVRHPQENASSSSSRTRVGSVSPPTDIESVGENTTLLNKISPEAPIYPQRSVVAAIKAFLMYQPRAIPVIEKALPSNETSILILAFIGLNVFYTVFGIEFGPSALFVFADRCGVVFVANLPLLYILAAKTQPLTLLTGYSYERLNILHRRLGEILCLEALMHGIGMVCIWYIVLRPQGFSLHRFLTEKIILFGIGAWLAFETLYFTSLRTFRRRFYELFLGLHVLLQLFALVFLYLHHPHSRVYVAISLAIFAIDRLICRLFLKSSTVEATLQILEDGETVHLSASISLRKSSDLQSIIDQIMGFWSLTNGWEATDHVFLSVPSISPKHVIQAHPFTICSPSPIHTTGEASIELLIRAQDGFSADLLKEAAIRQSITVRFAGPYGTSQARDLIEDADVALLVAGGSGIAVCWPLIHFILEQSRSSDTKIIPITELRLRRIILIWVVHKRSHLSWIGQRKLQQVADLGVEIVIPRATEEIGRPDLDVFIDDVVSRYGNMKKVGVVGSGPEGMNRTVRNSCSRLVRSGRKLNVTIEKYSW